MFHCIQSVRTAGEAIGDLAGIHARGRRYLAEVQCTAVGVRAYWNRTCRGLLVAAAVLVLLAVVVVEIAGALRRPIRHQRNVRGYVVFATSVPDVAGVPILARLARLPTISNTR